MTAQSYDGLEASSSQTDDIKLLDQIGIAAHLAWRQKNNATGPSCFQIQGYVSLDTKGVEACDLQKAFDSEHFRPVKAGDHGDDVWPSQMSAPIIEQVNEIHRFYGPPPESVVRALEGFLKKNQRLIEAELQSHFVVSYVKFDELLPGKSFGPSNWHNDGGPRFLRKILLYPGPLKRDSAGTLEFFDRLGKFHILKSEGPVAVLYDTSILLHRGHPPKTIGRPLIEITLSPAFETRISALFEGNVARVPRVVGAKIGGMLNHIEVPALPDEMTDVVDSRFPSLMELSRGERIKQRIRAQGLAKTIYQKFGRRFGWIKPTSTQLVYREGGPIRFLSGQATNKNSCLVIDGGKSFSQAGWINFDDRAKVPDQITMRATSKTSIPVLSYALDLVYMPPSIARHNTETLFRLLSESARCLNEAGRLIIQAPDYDALMSAWHEKNYDVIDRDWSPLADDKSSSPEAIFTNALVSFVQPGDGTPAGRRDDVFGDAEGGVRLSGQQTARLLKEAIDFDGSYIAVRQNGWCRDNYLDCLTAMGALVRVLDSKDAVRLYGWLPPVKNFKAPTTWIEAIFNAL